MFNKREFKKQVKKQVKAKVKEVRLDMSNRERNAKKELKRAKRIINCLGFGIIVTTFIYVFFIR